VKNAFELDEVHCKINTVKVAATELNRQWTVGTRPSPAAPIDQKPHPLTHESSSVGARPSPAAPIDQNHHPVTHERSSVGARSVLGRPRRSEPSIFSVRAYETRRY